jgi:hypothetical protein
VDNLLLVAAGIRRVARQTPPAVSRPNPALVLGSIQIVSVPTYTTCVSTSTSTNIKPSVSTDTNIELSTSTGTNIKPSVSTDTNIICLSLPTIFHNATAIETAHYCPYISNGESSCAHTSVCHVALLAEKAPMPLTVKY